MFKIELVEQTTKFNCGAAALAMILGLPSPEHVERDHMRRDCSTSHADRSIPTGQIGVFMEEAQRILFEAGIPALPYVNHLRCMTARAWVSRVWDRVRVADHDFLRKHLAGGGAAMLMVPSLNTPGGQHWIVVAGESVFDPSTKHKYRSYSEIPGLSDAILVGEPFWLPSSGYPSRPNHPCENARPWGRRVGAAQLSQSRDLGLPIPRNQRQA